MIYKHGRIKLSDKIYNSNDRKTLSALNQEAHLKALEQEKNLLISGEGLSCLIHDCYQRLIEDLSDYGYDIKVFAVVRPP